VLLWNAAPIAKMSTQDDESTDRVLEHVDCEFWRQMEYSTFFVPYYFTSTGKPSGSKDYVM